MKTMKGKKNIAVEHMLDYANNLLKNEKLSDEFKQGVESMIEEILHRTGNYAGFQYNYWAETGYKQWVNAGKPDFPAKQQFIGNEHNRRYF